MTEMKARLVDKDGNPLGTAANPLKISDHSISTATWGSITGTLSDQTDLNTTLIAKASSTPAALSILVYDGTPSAGDLTTYDEIYTTPALCFAALPAIINHAVTIKMRKADGSAYAAATLQRVVAGGSITIQGEYYYNNTVASAGSGTGKFNVIAGHSGLIQAGDKIFLMKYSGTVAASTPSDAFVDTVASVDGSEVSLTTRTTDTFDTSWYYVIVRTVCDRIKVISTDSVTIRGLYAKSSSSSSYTLEATLCNNFRFVQCIFESDLYHTIYLNKTILNTSVYSELNAIIYSNTTENRTCLNQSFGYAYIRKSAFFNSSSGGYAIAMMSEGNIYYSYVQATGSGQPDGIWCNGGVMTAGNTYIDGSGSDTKLPTALKAIAGGNISVSAVTFGSNITTQKSPANWAATTDGSYIS
jgi:hypothetical protein